MSTTVFGLRSLWLHGAVVSRVLVVAALCASCGGPAYGDGYLEAMSAGARARRAGRFDEAVAGYRKAAELATRLKDRDEAWLSEARVHVRTGAWTQAEAVYKRMAEAEPPGPRRGRAYFELARLALVHRDRAMGMDMLEKAALAFPNHGLTKRALGEIIAYREELEGVEGARRWLAAVDETFDGGPYHQLLLYEDAGLLERAERFDEAYRGYLKTAERYPYPFGHLTDDALWRASLIAEQQGRPGDAIQHLRDLLAPREVSTSMGSYERPRYTPAQWRIAELYRDVLKDNDKAREAFHRVYAAHTTSVKRDDALWEEAKLFAQDGDQDGACDTVELLADDFPDSRYASCGHELCPTVPADGARPCRDYIKRELEGPNASEPAPNGAD